MTRVANRHVFRLSLDGEPIADVEDPEALEALAASLRPGRYVVDAIIALPVDGFTSRRWGVVTVGHDGSVRIDR